MQSQRIIRTLWAIAPAVLLLLAVVVRPAAALAADDDAAVFKARCGGCHGPDGSASTPAAKAMKLRDLRSAEVQGRSDADLEQVIAKGSKSMPPFEKTLGADKVKAQLAYIRQLAKKK